MEPGYLLQIRAALLNVLHRLVKIHTLPTLRQPHTQRIMTIAKILRDGYGMSYRVDELAHMAGLSPSHFRLTFKNVTGMSPSTYQQQVKIAKATELLSDGECNVSEAARTVGFTDVHYFSRLYKKVTGNTPSSLIRQ
jgi:AraC-like DNA-binding protein